MTLLSSQDPLVQPSRSSPVPRMGHLATEIVSTVQWELFSFAVNKFCRAIAISLRCGVISSNLSSPTEENRYLKWQRCDVTGILLLVKQAQMTSPGSNPCPVMIHVLSSI
uniref:Ovule protein n=1 Tax=Ascaris lumbricoides TaxID=6252 RepID=A0A0M3IRP4_ASCLU